MARRSSGVRRWAPLLLVAAAAASASAFQVFRPASLQRLVGSSYDGGLRSRPRAVPVTRLLSSTSSSSSQVSADGMGDADASKPELKLPYPKIGDVVQFPGKWEGDFGIGQIRFLQRIQSRDEWLADIMPFKDVGEDLYRAEKGARTVTHPVNAIQPLSHFFIGSSDAYKVTHTKGAEGKRVPVTLALGYETKGFSLVPRKLDKEAMERARNEYEELKTRILKDTAIFGGACTVLAGVNVGIKDGAIFGAGVLGSLLYLFLLQQKADSFGGAAALDGTADAGNAVAGKVSSSLGNTRFLVPVALIAALAYKNLQGMPADEPARLFNYVPKDEFWAATLGFLSYRIPMLAREVNEILQRRKGGDTSTMGGSVRAGMALVDRLQGKESTVTVAPSAGAYRQEVTVVIVSGPEGMGKRALAQRLIQEDQLERYAAPVWVTTRDPRPGEQDGVDYHYMEDFAFQVMREQERFLFSYKDERGHWYGLRPSDITDVTTKKGKVAAVALDAYAADKLLFLNDARLIAVWVTLNTVDQLRDRYKKQLAAGSGGPAADEAEKEVEAAVSRATQAIEHALLETTKGFYEHTIYDDQGPDETYKKLRDFADFALSL